MTSAKQAHQNAVSVFKDKFLIGDLVVITTGRSKGQTGKLIKKIRTRQGLRYVVQGCNLQVKHRKGNQQLQQHPARVQIEGSVDASNVAIFNPATQKQDKIKYSIDTASGAKSRLYKSTGTPIEYTSAKKDRS